MSDPLEIFVVEDRIKQGAALLLLLVAAGAAAYLTFSTVVTSGTPVKAQVLHFGTYSAGRVAGGDLPILTVRLPDGSIRVVPATWQDVDHCARGRWISLLQNGTALQVGVPGCNATQ